MAQHLKIKSGEELLLDNVVKADVDDTTTVETMSETATALDCDDETEDYNFIDTVLEMVEETENEIEDNFSNDDNDFI